MVLLSLVILGVYVLVFELRLFAKEKVARGNGKSITLVEVAKHADKTSCYAVVRGKVFDLTTWIGEHPGGESYILSICGRDATSEFEGQHSGQREPEGQLSEYYIADLQR